MSDAEWFERLGRLPEPFFEHLHDANGDHEMAGAGSSGYTPSDPGDYYLEPNGSESIYINRLIFYMRSSGVWTAAKFASITALTNGIAVCHLSADAAKAMMLTADSPIKSNGGFAAHCYDARLDDFGSGDKSYVVRWTLKNAGAPVTVGPGERFSVLIQDDLSGVDTLVVKVDGYTIKGSRTVPYAAP